MEDKRARLPNSNMFKHYAAAPKTSISKDASGHLTFKTAADYERERVIVRDMSRTQ